jgi:cyclase
MHEVVEQTVASCFMPVTVGGGIRELKDIRQMLLCGADKVSLNTAAILNPEIINQASSQYGNQCIVVAIDAKQIPGKDQWIVYTHGGRKETSLNAISWAQEVVKRGAGEILLTSMDRDGTKDGYDLKLTRTLSDAVEVPVIASGGVGKPKHMAEGILEGRASAVLAASIFHFGEYSIKETKKIMQEQGVTVRL